MLFLHLKGLRNSSNKFINITNMDWLDISEYGDVQIVMKDGARSTLFDVEDLSYKENSLSMKVDASFIIEHIAHCIANRNGKEVILIDCDDIFNRYMNK